MNRKLRAAIEEGVERGHVVAFGLLVVSGLVGVVMGEVWLLTHRPWLYGGVLGGLFLLWRGFGWLMKTLDI